MEARSRVSRRTPTSDLSVDLNHSIHTVCVRVALFIRGSISGEPRARRLGNGRAGRSEWRLPPDRDDLRQSPGTRWGRESPGQLVKVRGVSVYGGFHGQRRENTLAGE